MRVSLSSGKPNIYAINTLRKRIKKHKPKSPYDDCPFCGSYLVVRVAKDKRRFIGCTAFPKCRFTAEESVPNMKTFSRMKARSQGR